MKADFWCESFPIRVCTLNPNESTRREIIESGAVALFTDGSHVEGSSGAGYVCPRLQLNRSLPLDRYTTMFYARVAAWLQGLKYIDCCRPATREEKYKYSRIARSRFLSYLVGTRGLLTDM